MAGTALPGRLTWQLAELVEVVVQTPRVKTIVFDVPESVGSPRAAISAAVGRFCHCRNRMMFSTKKTP